MDFGHMGPWWGDTSNYGFGFNSPEDYGKLSQEADLPPNLPKHDKHARLQGIGERKRLTPTQKRSHKRKRRLAKQSRKQNR